MDGTQTIRPLDDHVINQIAAGEVVERPLSVVKELTENALDSGADKISVEIVEGGLKRIIVSDNGSGIAANELPLAVQRHCTSKLSTAEQLLSLHTLGFRGEALASIAAVSRLSVISRTAAEAHASALSCHYGDIAAVKPAASYPQGTRVQIDNLFENVPARRKFQKQARTEYLHILQFLKQLAFCHEQVEFTFAADDKRVFKVPALTSAKAHQRRMQTLFGKDFSESALQIQCAELGFGVSGWVGRSDYHRPRSDLQYFALNQRVIRDQSLLHAIRLAYEGKVPDGRYPAFALRLSLAPSEVDVNVHPTKTQIRFAEPRRIHDQLYSFVSQTLERGASLIVDSPGDASSYRPPDARSGKIVGCAPRRANFVAETAPSFRSASQTSDLFSSSSTTAATFCGSIADDFAFIHTNEGVEIVNWQAFLSALFAHRLDADRRSRPLIVPEPVAAELAEFIEPRQDQLRAFGIVVESLGPARYALREMPVVLPPLDYAKFLRMLVSEDQTAIPDKLGIAAARSVSVPVDATSRQSWFEKLLTQAQALDLDWRQFGVRKSAQQWREFLSD